jgi:protein-L-isoaspartate(D-aspartate) O-methyltransferase
MPPKLVEQLKAPGKMFIPVGPPGDQYVVEVVKDKEGKVKTTKLYGVMYVPLCDRPSH